MKTIYVLRKRDGSEKEYKTRKGAEKARNMGDKSDVIIKTIVIHMK